MDMRNDDPDGKQLSDELSLETNIKLREIKPSSIFGRIVRIFFIIFMPFALLAGGAGTMVYLNANKLKVEPEKKVEKSATVEVLTAKFADVRPIVEIYGQTVAGKQLNLRANVGGEVVQISPNFKSGALVDKGELLFSVDPFNYEGALLSARNNYADTLTNIEELKLRSQSDQISLGTAKDQLISTQKDYDRGVILRERGTITSKALDDKLLVVTQRKQAVVLAENGLQAQLSQMKRYETGLKNIQYSIDKAERDLNSTKIYASFDAYVQNANMQIGQLVGTNEQTATLIDRDQMDIVFTLSDSLYGRILAQDGTLIGREVNLIWQAGTTTQEFTATIDRVAAQITASSGGIELFARINNLQDIATLRVGSFMTVQIPDRLFKNVLRLPEHIIYDGNLLYVVETRDVEPGEVKDGDAKDEVVEAKIDVVKTETRLKPVPIKIIGYDGKFALIDNLSDGIKISNDDVILATKLSTAGTDVLVVTRAVAERRFIERSEKLAVEQKQKAEDKKQAELEKDATEKVGE
ncbi:MAG: HlyD family efflux transporter periplasmic adaptor subunit [OCS116 cluster bacterium]|nr:HlyD family efflux transporter periplasmic adaptor subunit [OCS116 cluster bacterium]